MRRDMLHTRILQECQRAEEAADRIFHRKLDAESMRHEKRLAELETEREQAKAAARAMRDLVPQNDTPPADTSDAYAAGAIDAFASDDDALKRLAEPYKSKSATK
jgi:hypothetical protein